MRGGPPKHFGLNLYSCQHISNNKCLTKLMGQNVQKLLEQITNLHRQIVDIRQRMRTKIQTTKKNHSKN